MSTMGDTGRQLLGIVLGGACVLGASCATAQITPDKTLPNNSNVTINGSVFNITGGTQAGRNLFHSFQQFSVPTGTTAFFNNGLDIQNIFSRVTGGSVSTIDGLIKANGTANLFLINPSGIMFGPNASLGLNGSFFASTANSLVFDNGFEFSATNPQAQPLLTVNIPIGLRFRDNPGGITTNQSVLQVPSGNTLALVGGNVNLNSGGLIAEGGRVELGGLTAAGTVGLQVNGNNLSLSFPDNVTRADVSLSNGAIVYVAAGGGGSIAVNANNLNIMGGSDLIAGIAPGMGSVAAKAGDITLNATGDIKIDGSIGNNVGALNNPQNNLTKGNGGNIEINTSQLELTNGAQLQASTFGKGDAGNVIVNATNSVSLAGSGTDIFSTVGAVNNSQNNFAIGKGGDIQITTGQLSLSNGTQLQASTFGKGDAGNVIVNATNSVSLAGSGTGILSTVGDVNNSQNNFAIGKGGDIQITTGQLSLSNGAQLQASTFGKGDAGNVSIKASGAVSLTGVNNGLNSRIFSIVQSTGIGKGGNIDIQAGSLSLTDGGTLSSSTFGQGDAGNVSVNTTNGITLSGVNTSSGSPSQIGSITDSPTNSNAGNINIIAGSLSLQDGAQLTTNTYEKGNAGNVMINVSGAVNLSGFTTLNLNGSNSSFFNSIQSLVGQGAVGNGGNIDIKAGSLSLNDSSVLATGTSGQGNAGNVSVRVDDSVTIAKISNIRSNVEQGGQGIAGDLNIQARSLTLTDGGQIDATVFRADENGQNGGKGEAGNIFINATDFVNISGVSSFQFPVSFPTVGFSSGLLASAERGTTNTTPKAAGNIIVTTGDFRIADGAVVDALTSNSGRGGDIVINAKTFTATGGGQVLTTARSSGNAGNITLNISDSVSFSGTDSNFNQRLQHVKAYTSIIDDIINNQGPASGIFANTTSGSTARGGDLTINTRQLDVRNGGTITVSSPQGQAGNLTITAKTVGLDQGNLTAETAITSPNDQGVNIKLQGLDLLFLRNNSLISAQATSNTANGGNITIDAPNGFVVATPGGNNGSDIVASAFGGQGGNIQITAQSIYGLTPGRSIVGNGTNDIDASSQFNQAGTVNLNTSYLNPNQSLVKLPENVFDPTTQIAQNPCQRGAGSTFAITGRGGIPSNPNQTLASDNVRVGLVTPASSRRTAKTTATRTLTQPTVKRLVPAQGWVFNDKGQVVLTAYDPTKTGSQRSWREPASCAPR